MRAKTVPVDQATGLPAAPEGLFWRVTYHQDGEIYGNGWRLELRLPASTRWRPARSLLVDSVGLHYEDEISDAALIRETAAGLLADREVRLARASLAGDYPPKRLES